MLHSSEKYRSNPFNITLTLINSYVQLEHAFVTNKSLVTRHIVRNDFYEHSFLLAGKLIDPRPR